MNRESVSRALNRAQQCVLFQKSDHLGSLSDLSSGSAPAGPALAVESWMHCGAVHGAKVRFGSRFTPGSSVESLP